MRCMPYQATDSPEAIPGTISYSIEWAYDPSSGFSPPESTTATKSIIIYHTLNQMLESDNAWGSETDFTIDYPIITVTGVSPAIMESPPTRIIVDQQMNTYKYTEIGR